MFFCCQDYESSAMCSVQNEADVSENLSHVKPVVVMEALNSTRYLTLLKYVVFDKSSVPVSKISIK